MRGHGPHLGFLACPTSQPPRAVRTAATGGTVRPITRWGTPSCTGAAAGHGVRRSAAPAGRRHGRHDVRRRRRRPGGLPDRRGPRDVRLRLPRRDGRRTVGVVCNPGPTPRGSDRSSTRTTRAACRSPARSSSARDRTTPWSPAPARRRTRGVQRRRHARALPPARDRPHQGHGVRRPAADQAAQEADQRPTTRPPRTSPGLAGMTPAAPRGPHRPAAGRGGAGPGCRRPGSGQRARRSS